jgi:predicted Zn-dependent protease
MEQTPEQHNGSNGEDISAISVSGKAGRPSLYSPETVERLLDALRAGLTHKQACLACGIGQSTLADWRERHPDLEAKMEEARETARQIALEKIKAAGDKDWRATAEWLKLTYPDCRPSVGKVEVTASASAGNFPVLTPERQAELQERLARLRRERLN